MCPDRKVPTMLLENPVSQQFPGLTLSMQILICFPLYLPFPHARYRTNSVCALASYTRHNPVGESSNKKQQPWRVLEVQKTPVRVTA